MLADSQSGGRGREGRSWASPPGGLYLSVLLRPRFAHASVLPLAAGVAVAEAVEEHGARASLKWPNDVLARRAQARRHPRRVGLRAGGPRVGRARQSA